MSAGALKAEYGGRKGLVIAVIEAGAVYLVDLMTLPSYGFQQLLGTVKSGAVAWTITALVLLAIYVIWTPYEYLKVAQDKIAEHESKKPKLKVSVIPVVYAHNERLLYLCGKVSNEEGPIAKSVKVKIVNFLGDMATITRERDMDLAWEYGALGERDMLPGESGIFDIGICPADGNEAFLKIRGFVGNRQAGYEVLKAGSRTLEIEVYAMDMPPILMALSVQISTDGRGNDLKIISASVS